MTGAARNCAATTFAAPTGRRRRDLIKREAEEEATQLDAPGVTVQGACEEGDTVCVNEVADQVAAVAEEQAEDVSDAINDVVQEAVEEAIDAIEEAVEVESAVAQTTLTLAALSLALLN